MRIRNLRRATASVLAAAGLLWAQTDAQAQMNHAVGDPSFEDIGLGVLDYYYFQGPPNSPFWKDHPFSAGKNGAYNANFATVTSPDTPDPRTGDQAVDGEGAYNYQVLEDVFVAGRTYTYTAYTQGWGNNLADSLDRFWLYLFAGGGASGDAAPGDGASGTMDGNAILRAAWHQDGVIDNVLKTGAGAHSFLPFTGFVRAADAQWTQVGMSYTATEADAGKRIGLGFWANELGAVDDIALTSVESPPGDYNRNGSVGPEDYALWTNTFGDTVAAGAGADGNGDTLVNAADYVIWRKYAPPAAARSALAVPEPGTICLGGLAFSAVGIVASARRRTICRGK